MFKLSGKNNSGEVSIVEHPFEVGLLSAAHRHTREDEHSIVLAGEIGFRSDDSEVVLGPGGYITKPRGQMHAMWNAGSEPGRIVEVITPGGFENYFRELGELLVEHASDPVGKVLHELPEFGELADKYGLTYGISGLDGRHRGRDTGSTRPRTEQGPPRPAIWRARTHSVTLHLPDAGWSSSVARWAHNPEVAGSNPVPATMWCRKTSE